MCIVLLFFKRKTAYDMRIRDWSSDVCSSDLEICTIPDEIDDAQAIALGISGTCALIPLEEARIQKGERVLILGATGPVGQAGLQIARALGAGQVVAAARNLDALNGLKERGIADDIVQLGGHNDEEALKVPAGPGYDVVLDAIYGPPAEAESNNASTATP